MTWTLLLFYGPELLIRRRPAITLFAQSVTASVFSFEEVENGLNERFQASPVLLRDVEVPQSGHWWILGSLEGGHKERSEHCRWRWHDPDFAGCLPRTHRCPSAHLQQRVSVTQSFESLLLNSTKILPNLANFGHLNRCSYFQFNNLQKCSLFIWFINNY